jgi:serine/threonine protein phosphatase 1
MNIWEEVAQKEKLLSGSDIIEAEEGMLFEPDVSGFRRILAVGDLHGNYRRFQSLWSRVDYRPSEDLLVFVGDYIDRGEQVEDCLKAVRELKAASPYVITLSGNHEQMLREYFEGHSIDDPPDVDDEGMWLTNGGDVTLDLLKRIKERSEKEYEDLMRFFHSLPYIAFCGPYVFTHAGFWEDRTLAEQKGDMLWLREKFYRGYQGERTVIVGHTPVQFFGTSECKPVFFDNHIIDIDTGSYLRKGRISCMDLKTKQIWQSDI